MLLKALQCDAAVLCWIEMKERYAGVGFVVSELISFGVNESLLAISYYRAYMYNNSIDRCHRTRLFCGT